LFSTSQRCYKSFERDLLFQMTYLIQRKKTLRQKPTLGKNVMHIQIGKFSENKTFSWLCLLSSFAGSAASFEMKTTSILYRRPTKPTGRISEFSLYFSCLFYAHFLGRRFALVFAIFTFFRPSRHFLWSYGLDNQIILLQILCDWLHRYTGFLGTCSL